MPALNGDATQERRRALFAEALALIERRYADERLAVTRLSQDVFCSRRQIQRCFAEAGKKDVSADGCQCGCATSSRATTPSKVAARARRAARDLERRRRLERRVDKLDRLAKRSRSLNYRACA